MERQVFTGSVLKPGQIDYLFIDSVNNRYKVIDGQNLSSLPIDVAPYEPLPPTIFYNKSTWVPSTYWVRLIDLTGDGLDDLLYTNLERTVWNVAINQGGMFAPPQTWLTSAPVLYPKVNQTAGMLDVYWLQDANGDGLPDLYWKEDKVVRLAYNTGTKFLDSGQSIPYSHNLSFGDLNGDGRADSIGQESGNASGVVYAFGRREPGFDSKNRMDWGKLALDRPTPIADFSGDGLGDMQSFGGAPSYLKNNAPLDLLTQFHNGYGSITEFEYTPAAHWPNNGGRVSHHTVSKMIVHDGRGNQAVTRYEYEGGRFDTYRWRFAGFANSKTFLPCENTGQDKCAYTETWSEYVASPGWVVGATANGAYYKLLRPRETHYRDGNGKLLRATIHTYTGIHKVSTSEYEFDPASSKSPKVFRRRYVSRCEVWAANAYPLRGKWTIRALGELKLDQPHVRACRKSSYDRYGNLLQERDHGDYAVAGDERETVTEYAYNKEKYLVSFPSQRIVYGKDRQTKLHHQTFLYDYETGEKATTVKLGLVTTNRDWLNTENRFLTTRTYYVYGLPYAVQSPNGQWSLTGYDPVFHQYPTITELRSADQSKQRTTQTTPWHDWDLVCRAPTRGVDENGQVTKTVYDDFCRPTLIETPLGGFTRTKYCKTGDKRNPCEDPHRRHIETETPGPNGSVIWRKQYVNGVNQVWQTEQKAAAHRISARQVLVTETEYTPRGQVARQSRPHFANATPRYTETTYDALGRPSQRVQSDDTKVTQHYGLASVTLQGQPQVLAWKLFRNELFYDPQKPDKSREHQHIDYMDIRDQQVIGIDFLDASVIKTHYRYDSRGNLSHIIDAKNNTWTYLTDSLGRRIEEVDPNRGLILSRYYDSGQLHTRSDAKGVIKWTYDDFSRVKTRSVHPGKPQARTYTFYYDTPQKGFFNRGRLTSIDDPQGMSKTFNYDAAGRLAHEIRTVDNTDYHFSWTYDAGGRLLTTTYPDDTRLGPLGYDAAGRLASIPGILRDIVYHSSGVPSRIYGIHVGSQRFEDTRRGWTDAIHIHKIKHGATSYYLDPQNRIRAIGYSRDIKGRITREHAGTGTNNLFAREDWSYTYDALDRLSTARCRSCPEETRSYYYDAIGNITAHSHVGCYIYDPQRPHAVRNAGAHSYDYDAVGNMIQRDQTVLDYDGEHRLVSITAPPQNTGGADRITRMAYNHAGERIKLVRPNGSMTLYLGDGYEITDGTVTKYIRAVGQLVAKTVTPKGHAAKTYWFHTDIRGSVRMITNDKGEQVQRMNYAPFGKPFDKLTTAHKEAVGYIGEHQDESGLTYLVARYYDPAIGRFISADPSFPLQQGVGLNGYAYSQNSPIDKLDPSGMAAITLTAAAIWVGKSALEGFTDASVDAGIARATGQEFGIGKFAKSALIGTGVSLVGAGFVSKINKLRKIRQVSRTINSTGDSRSIRAWDSIPDPDEAARSVDLDTFRNLSAQLSDKSAVIGIVRRNGDLGVASGASRRSQGDHLGRWFNCKRGNTKKRGT